MKKCLHVCVAVFLTFVIVCSQARIVEASFQRYQAPIFYSIDDLIEWVEAANAWHFQSGRFASCLYSARSHGEIVIPTFDNPDIVLRGIEVLPRVHESGRFVHSGYMFTRFSYNTPEGSISIRVHRINQLNAEIYETYGIEGYTYAITEGIHEPYQTFGEITVTTRTTYTDEISKQRVSYTFVDMLNSPYYGPVAIVVAIVDGREVAMQYSDAESRVHFENMVLETVPITDRELPGRTIRFEMGNTAYTINDVAHTNDVAPFIDPAYNRAMVPLRAVTLALAGEILWVSQTRAVHILSGMDFHRLVVDEALPDGMGRAAILDDRVFVPIRYVSEIPGADTRWDAENSAVYIYSRF